MSEQVRILNKSKQMIPLQVRPPNGEFYTTEQQIRLMPGKTVELPEEYAHMEQIQNLRKKGILQII